MEVENEVRWESVRSGYPLFEEAVGGGIGVVPADERRPGPRTEDQQGGGVVGARARLVEAQNGDAVGRSYCEGVGGYVTRQCQ